MSRAILTEVMKQPFTNTHTEPVDKTFKYACAVFPKPPAYFVEAATSQKNLRTDFTGPGLSVSDGESNSEDEKLGMISQNTVDITKILPPIGVFWDIENCQVPRRKSAVAIAQAIRDRFFNGYREAEFVVVCDVTKENSRVIKELNYAQVNLIHVSATCKNAADEKLRQSIRRFADIHSAPAAIILISSDVNFAGDLSDLRHRKKLHVILLHNDQISEALILCANEHYSFNDIIDSTITKREVKESNTVVEVLVSNLPKEKDSTKIKIRLKQLCDNLGGRVSKISKSVFSIRFPTVEFALRAQKRMAGEDVFGNKIKVSNPFPVEEEWSFQSNGSRKIYAKDDLQISHYSAGAGAGRNNSSNNKRDKDENSMPFDDFYPRKQHQLAAVDAASSGPNPHHLEPTLQQQISKTIVPFTSNNMSSFTFSKVPNIENLKIIQNPTSSSIQKSYLNNLETYAGVVGSGSGHSKQYLENGKFNNIFTNQTDCSSLVR